MHTPGPWKYVGRLGYGHLVDPNIAVAYGGEGSGHADDGEANAKLIAAAPDLLEALKECLREHGGFTIKGECERRARAAISKAEQ